MEPTTPYLGEEVEALIRRVTADVTRPRSRECICCYVARLLREFPCDGTHRHAFKYRDAMAPRATALAERLSRVGACCCDCELFLNGYRLRSLRSRDFDDLDEDDDDEEDPSPLDIAELPRCAGVRRGSVRACGNWVPIYRR